MLFVAVSSVVGKVIESGTSSTMVRLNRTDTDPPELLPLNVNSVRFRSCVGVPQIVPLAEPSSRPVGRLGAMDHVVMVPFPVRLTSNGPSAVLLVPDTSMEGRSIEVGT